ncbi:hypothetical protein EW146_g879 [Bondarzewia mesenterica]|uniref:Uncharacterized protein n=1 Tax=Bondarzewia mesenterica TaxID=1095465 RepID=A0A4S4M5L7_9AGAM|nr:hypothetical protein EW146_g879 [Bondarzewia mesenterica]
MPASPSVPTSPPTPQPNKTKLLTIVVVCVGGFIAILIAVLVIVPLARRYHERRRSLELDSEHSSVRGHQRLMSGPDLSMPLLNSDDPESERPHIREMPHDCDANARHAYGGEPSGSVSVIPAIHKPTISVEAQGGSSGDADSAPSRSLRFPPTLRRARTRVAHTPMAPLPEDTATDVIPPPKSPVSSSPSPSSPSASSNTHSTWLHIPFPTSHGGAPLIGAFRGSVSSTTSTNSTLPSIQHYPSFSSRSRSPNTFYSLSSASFSASASSGPPARGRVAPTEHGELQPLPARLRASGGPQQTLAVTPVNDLPVSRQASLLHGAELASPAGWEGQRRSNGYATSTNASSLSVYTDARSM